MFDVKGRVMRKSVVGISVAVLSLFNAVAAAEPVTIVHPEGPLPSVVTTDQKSDRDSATDFCDYFSRVIGRKVAISEAPAPEGVIIHVGKDTFAGTHAPEIDNLFADGYVLKMVKSGGRNHLVLAGKIPPSPQWAVEQFLKDYCGVRWLFPDPRYGEIVPSRPTITVDSSLSRSFEPNYMNRANCGMYYFNPAHTLLRLRPKGYAAYGSHGLQFIFKEAEFKDHPEWFAYFMDDRKSKSNRGWENGKPQKRRQWWSYGNGWQICTSNQGTIDHTVNYVLDHFKKNPNSPVVSVGANDGHGWCDCSECKSLANSFTPAYTTSELWWHWVNQVAKEVAKTYPNKWIESLAYGTPITPPRFKLQPNIAITVTVILGDGFDTIEKWKPLCKSINLYTYAYGKSFFGFRHYPHALQDFLKWGHDDLGALAHVTECGGDWTIDGPKYHYMQALQWDVNTDVDKLMDDFCNDSYGKASKPMRVFWDRLEQCYENRPLVPYGKDLQTQRLCFYMWVSWQSPSYLRPDTEFEGYTIEDIDVLDKTISLAVSLATADTQEVQFRVERMADAWRYVRTMLLSKVKYYDNPPSTAVKSETQKQAAISFAKDMAQLRANRHFYAGKMRQYPHINFRMKLNYYWSMGSALTLFSRERTLLDELCTAVTAYIETTQDHRAAKNFWRNIGHSDNLRESAQTQLYMLNQTNLTNVLVNSDFENGTVNGWTASGSSSVISGDNVYQGRHCLMANKGTTLTQDVSVWPQQRFRLTVWVKPLKAHEPDPQLVRDAWVSGDVDSDAPSAETNINFYESSGGVGAIWHEPARNVLSLGDPADGWKKLRTTVTVPGGATIARITLKTNVNDILLDDIMFERIKDASAVQYGNIIDNFNGQSLNTEKWFQPVSSGGTEPPKIDDGWLVYDNENMYPLISQTRVDDLLKYENEDRYCLRFHAQALSGKQEPSSLTWGIKSRIDVINIRQSGMYWTHSFGSAKKPQPQLYYHSSQSGQRKIAMVHTLKHLAPLSNEVWYTVFFDTENVTVYASGNGYDESEKSLAVTYKHGITNITADGSVYLKLDSGRYMLDEISLASPKKPAAATSSDTTEEPSSGVISYDEEKEQEDDLNLIEVPLDLQ